MSSYESLKAAGTSVVCLSPVSYSSPNLCEDVHTHRDICYSGGTLIPSFSLVYASGTS